MMKGRFALMLRGIALIVSVAAVVLLVRETGLADSLADLHVWIDAHVRGQGLAGEAVFIAAAAAATAVGLPRQAFAIAGGYAFGVALGSLLTLAGCVLGCLAAFAYARWLGRAAVVARYPERIRRIDAFLGEHPILMTLAVRLMPVGSNLVTNLVAGVSSVATGPFLLGSALGYLPQIVVFALVGSGVEQGTLGRTVMAIALFVASASIGLYLYRRHRRGRGFDDAVDAALEGDDDGPAATSVAVAADRDGPTASRLPRG